MAGMRPVRKIPFRVGDRVKFMDGPNVREGLVKGTVEPHGISIFCAETGRIHVRNLAHQQVWYPYSAQHKRIYAGPGRYSMGLMDGFDGMFGGVDIGGLDFVRVGERATPLGEVELYKATRPAEPGMVAFLVLNRSRGRLARTSLRKIGPLYGLPPWGAGVGVAAEGRERYSDVREPCFYEPLTGWKVCGLDSGDLYFEGKVSESRVWDELIDWLR